RSHRRSHVKAPDGAAALGIQCIHLARRACDEHPPADDGRLSPGHRAWKCESPFEFQTGYVLRSEARMRLKARVREIRAPSVPARAVHLERRERLAARIGMQ